MSGAEQTLDPIEAAQVDISRSKDLIASTIDDLRQHHRWLEDYHLAERQRARRLRRQELLYQLGLKRRRLMAASRRVALIILVVALLLGSLLVKSVAAVLRWVWQLILAVVAWTVPRMKAAGIAVWRAASAGLDWAWRTSATLANAGFEAVSSAFAWSVRNSETLGITFRGHFAATYAALHAEAAVRIHHLQERAATGWAWAERRSLRAALVLRKRLSDGWAWTEPKAIAASRAVAANAHQGAAWLADRSVVIGTATQDLAVRGLARSRSEGQALARTARRTAQTVSGRLAVESATLSRQAQRNFAAAAAWSRANSQSIARVAFKTASNGWSWVALRATYVFPAPAPRMAVPVQTRALVVRRCTALVCTEPWRARLPAVRGPHPVFEPTGRDTVPVDPSSAPACAHKDKKKSRRRRRSRPTTRKARRRCNRAP